MWSFASILSASGLSDSRWEPKAEEPGCLSPGSDGWADGKVVEEALVWEGRGSGWEEGFSCPM